ncbi:glycoside hydrolase family 3 N-terminal domain-containing protein [uncultured Sphaerochaeta sp.]|uniref:glycoside hydrolase family 3 protein n=1 Tax=uncultured Sphaerochaeta sp. TaxID=886478 RepID=UPI002A0A423C|nr:glycoside hydrolase family 3 N-terminal domain-containing protein [uncultured Sphaerochaeta sp.]
MIDFKAKPFNLSEEDIKWVKDTLHGMSIEEKAGQLFCVLFKNCVTEEFEYVFKILSPGGCMYRVLPTEIAVNATNTLQSKSKIPLLIAANLEKGGNGIVTEGTLVGSPMEIAATGDISMAVKMATVCAKEAMAVGSNWAFAPIIDIDSNFRNPITNTRTFGSNPETVKKMGKAYVETVQKMGMAASIKHFPGDGQDERDQHLVTSINNMDAETWMNTYGMAYKASIEAGALTVMAGHIMQPAWSRLLDPSLKDSEIKPATLSKELLQGLLRGNLGFNGLICTDATTMAGFMLPLSRRLAVPYCIAAGCDMFLFARNLEEDFNFMLDGIRNGIITSERLDEAVSRILATKAALKLHTHIPEISLEKAKCIIGSEEHHAWAKECADKGITLVKKQEGILPLSVKKYKKILFYTIEPAIGGEGNYQVSPACNKVKLLLEKEGFEVDDFVPQPYGEGFTTKYMDFVNTYDLIVYVANLSTKSNQTVVRIEWKQPMGADCSYYIHDIPTIFISLENPYHLLDSPRVKTYINTYSNNDSCIDVLVEKLMGRSEFIGQSPVDAFCGKWDARL